MAVFKDNFSIHQGNKLLPEVIIQNKIEQGLCGKGNVVIYFEVENLTETFNLLKSRSVKFIHDIVELPWQKIFRIYDPDNYIIEIGNIH